MRGTTDQQIESLVALTPKDLVPQEREGVGALGLGAAIRSPEAKARFRVRVRGEAGATRPGSCGACPGAGLPAPRSRRRWRCGGPAVPSPPLQPLR